MLEYWGSVPTRDDFYLHEDELSGSLLSHAREVGVVFLSKMEIPTQRGCPVLDSANALGTSCFYLSEYRLRLYLSAAQRRAYHPKYVFWRPSMENFREPLF